MIKLAQDEYVKRIVAGTHGRSGLGRLQGSVAEKLIEHAPCAVVGVRLPGDAVECVE